MAVSVPFPPIFEIMPPKHSRGCDLCHLARTYYDFNVSHLRIKMNFDTIFIVELK